MMDRLLEQFDNLLDRAAAFVWELFQKDLEMTESILQRTETLFATVESKLPTSIRRFFDPSDR